MDSSMNANSKKKYPINWSLPPSGNTKSEGYRQSINVLKLSSTTEKKYCGGENLRAKRTRVHAHRLPVTSVLNAHQLIAVGLVSREVHLSFLEAATPVESFRHKLLHGSLRCHQNANNTNLT